MGSGAAGLVHAATVSVEIEDFHSQSSGVCGRCSVLLQRKAVSADGIGSVSLGSLPGVGFRRQRFMILLNGHAVNPIV